jgi:hypothetical protein
VSARNRAIITTACEILGLAALCAAGFVLGTVFDWAYVWVGLVLTGAALWIVSWILGE